MGRPEGARMVGCPTEVFIGGWELAGCWLPSPIVTGVRSHGELGSHPPRLNTGEANIEEGGGGQGQTDLQGGGRWRPHVPGVSPMSRGEPIIPRYLGTQCSSGVRGCRSTVQEYSAKV